MRLQAYLLRPWTGLQKKRPGCRFTRPSDDEKTMREGSNEGDFRDPQRLEKNGWTLANLTRLWMEFTNPRICVVVSGIEVLVPIEVLCLGNKANKNFSSGFRYGLTVVMVEETKCFGVSDEQERKKADRYGVR